MTAATVAMFAPLCSVLGGIHVHRVAVDAQVGVHPNRTPALLRDLPEQAGGAREQREPSQQLDGQAQVGERGAADTGAVERERAAEDLLMGSSDGLEEPQVRAPEALLLGDPHQSRRAWVLHLVDRVPQPGDVPALLSGTP